MRIVKAVFVLSVAGISGMGITALTDRLHLHVLIGYALCGAVGLFIGSVSRDWVFE